MISPKATDTDHLLQGDYRSSDHRSSELSPPRVPDWSAAAVRLLQGVVYQDEHEKLYEVILRSVSPLTEYFAKIGLLLVVDELDAMAYLRSWNEDEAEDETHNVPRLFRRTPLGYDATLLAVLLRDRLRQFEEEDVQNARCVVPQADLLELWRLFFPQQTDEVRLNRSLQSALRKLEEIKFVRQFEQEPPTWEVRRIIKARLPLEELERLRNSMTEAIAMRAASDGRAEEDPTVN